MKEINIILNTNGVNMVHCLAMERGSSIDIQYCLTFIQTSELISRVPEGDLCFFEYETNLIKNL